MVKAKYKANANIATINEDISQSALRYGDHGGEIRGYCSSLCPLFLRASVRTLLQKLPDKKGFVAAS